MNRVLQFGSFMVIGSFALARVVDAQQPFISVAWDNTIAADDLSNRDSVRGVAVGPHGSVYVSGQTRGVLAGSQAGLSDAFVRKYSPGGEVLWTQQFGSAGPDFGHGIAVDSTGHAYLAGVAGGDGLAGAGFGGDDAYLIKLDPSGGVVWSEQFGTTTIDRAWAITLDTADNAYVVGSSFGPLASTPARGNSDAYAAKFNPSGERLWITSFGSARPEQAYGVTVDAAGDLVIAGSQSAPGTGRLVDGLLTRIDSDGSLVWSIEEQVGGRLEYFDAAADPDGAFYVVGVEGLRGVLRRYESDGSLVWSRPLDDPVQAFGNDTALSVEADALGNAYVAGVLNRQPYVAKYTREGRRLWLEALGLGRTFHGIALSGQDTLVVGGDIGFRLTQGLVAKLRVVPEPSTCLLVATIMVSALNHMSFRGRCRRDSKPHLR